ncbi:MAG: haloacid dehalogenase type II, partial [Leeuwenhoekiella sp.]
MTKSRRNFIKNATIAGFSGIAASNTVFGATPENNQTNLENITTMKRPKVLFFDVNESLLDLGKLKKSVGQALQGREDLVPLWFTTMLQYSLVSTTGRQYEDFGIIGAATLRMVAANNGIELTEEESKEALSPIRSLMPHPEVKEALGNLKDAG